MKQTAIEERVLSIIDDVNEQRDSCGMIEKFNLMDRIAVHFNDHTAELQAKHEEQLKEAVIKAYRDAKLGDNTVSVSNHELLIEEAEAYYNETYKKEYTKH